MEDFFDPKYLCWIKFLLLICYIWTELSICLRFVELFIKQLEIKGSWMMVTLVFPIFPCMVHMPFVFCWYCPTYA